MKSLTVEQMIELLQLIEDKSQLVKIDYCINIIEVHQKDGYVELEY